MNDNQELTQQLRESLVKFDFEYFLKKNIEQENYPNHCVQEIYNSKEACIEKLKTELKKNKKQTLYHIDGEITKAVRGGMLMSHFNLSDARGFKIMNFSSYGNEWANFEIWRKYELRKSNARKAWDWFIKIGAGLAIILSIIKLCELLGSKL